MNPRRQARAFTLLELLVVVAVIALLVSVLLPSLHKAREQAKRVVCQSNERTIGVAAQSYIQAERERFCWGPIYPAWSTGPAVTTYYYGGRIGASWLTYRYPDRPLNRYVFNRNVKTQSSLQNFKVFECPSNVGVRWNSSPDPTPSNRGTCFEELGTSFQLNTNWRYWSIQWHGNSAEAQQKRFRMADTILRYFLKQPVRFILFYEDPTDWMLANSWYFQSTFPKYQVPGWHKRLGWHSVQYLDGHGDYIYIDWKKNTPRTGYADARWYVHPDNPDEW